MSYISKWRLQNNSVVPVGSNLFGTCNSSSSDTTKVVSLSAFNVLVEGVTIHVYFANANSGSNTLLQVGSTSAQPIKRNGVAEGKWESGSVISFTYSQGYWVQNDADVGGGVAETYTLSKIGNIIELAGSGGDTSSVIDDNTTYAIAVDGYQIVLTDSDGYSQRVTLPSGMFIVDESNTLDEICGAHNDDRVIYYQYWENVSTLRLLPLAEIDCSDHALFAQIINDGTDTYLLIAMVDENDDWSTSAIPIETTDTTYELENNLETITHMLYVNLDGGGYEYYEDNFVVNNNGVEYLVGDHQVYIVDSDGNDITGISTYNLRWTGTQTDAYTFGQNLYDYFATHNAYRLKIDGVLTQKITKYGTYYGLTEALPEYDRVTAKEWVHEGTGGDVFGVTAQGVVLGNKSTIDLVGSDGTISSVNLKAIDIGALPTAQYHVNDATHDGYVKSPSGLPGIRVWKTDETGEPGWRLENGDTTYTISISGNVITLTPSSGTAQTITLPIPTATSDLINDSDFVSDANYVHTDNNFTTAEKNKLSGIEAGAEVNVQANWNETDSTSDAYIQNKPTIPTPPSPSSTTPLMDGTASVGSEANYARGDHRHPSDTSKQDTLVSGTNIKTINGNSVLGSGDLVVGGSVTSTDVPTSDTISEFDSDAHMNSTDMTSQEVEDFVDGLNVTGGITDDDGTWKSVNNYLKYSKRFGCVYIQGVSSGNLTLTAASWNNLGTLPEGYRPTSEIMFTAFDRNHLQPLWCSVTTAGVVRLYCDSGQACSYWLYGGSFPVAS